LVAISEVVCSPIGRLVAVIEGFYPAVVWMELEVGVSAELRVVCSQRREWNGRRRAVRILRSKSFGDARPD
jgi:hypothetical protein